MKLTEEEIKIIGKQVKKISIFLIIYFIILIVCFIYFL